MTQSRPTLILLAPDPASGVGGAAPTTASRAGAPTTVADEEAEYDLGVLRRVQAGDPEALDALLQKYWCPLVAYAARLLSSEDGAEDVAQEVFIRIWERRTALTPMTAVRPLLYRIARNVALNERRSREVRGRWLQADHGVGPQRTPTPLHATIVGELQVAISRAIDGLPPRRREAFTLARFHELSHRQIAEVMGVSPQTVANQISGALDDLRRALRAYLEPEHPAG